MAPLRFAKPGLSRFFAAGLALVGVVISSTARAETLLVKNGLFITMNPAEPTPFVGYMTVGDDGKIATIAAGAPPAGTSAERVIDAGGKFVAPGFVSSHSHLGSAPFRGLGHTETLYSWSRATQRLNRYSTAEDVYWYSLFGAYEFLRNGITTVYDFTNAGSTGQGPVGINDPVPAMGLRPGPFEQNQLRAKFDAGIRFVNGIGLAPVGSRAEIVGRVEAVIAYARESFPDNPLLLRMALNGGVQRASSKATAELEVYLMKTYGLLNQAHFLESPERIPEQQAKFAWYVDAGALGPDFIFGHFIHTTPEMVRIAAQAGAAMSWQPMSNGRLASGVADIVAYRAMGLRVGVGLDSNACTDTCDPFSNVRTGLALIRTTYKDAKALSIYEMLRLHTMGSAEVMGVADKVGSLERGKFADFLIVDPRDPDTGPVHEAIATYVLACGLRNLKQVYVGGKLVADGTTLVGRDE
ncbi:MAG: amidohydrolase family protein, partial [Verrucomicrobiota bacterium]